MQTKKRSPIAAIVLAVVIGLLVIALLNGVIRPTQVVVAKVAIAPGTVLTDQLVELRTIPMGAKPADATSKIEDVTGKILAVGRAPGDLIVTSVWERLPVQVFLLNFQKGMLLWRSMSTWPAEWLVYFVQDRPLR